MKVSDVMSTQVDYVSPKTSIRDVCRIIFGAGIKGVPVCEEKKVVGFVTERDILSKFYPSIQEFIEDPIRSSDFEEMEKQVEEILSFPVKEIMSKNPITITADTPLLRAQSFMFIHKVGRLPVVDEKEHIVGILSKGDIFKSIVGEKIPYAEDEEYHDWLSKRYDTIVKWEIRLGHEIPDLVSLFQQEKVKKVLDMGSGTGEHDIALAKRGLHVVALERSKLMFKTSQEKWKELPEMIQKRIVFETGDYRSILETTTEEFDAAIFMGNALSHNASDYREILSAVSKRLSKNATLVFQIVNFEKIFKANKRLQDFNIGQSKNDLGKENAFIEFYDPPRKRSGPYTLNMTILYFNGKRWIPRGLNSTPIANITMDSIDPLLKKLGFSQVSYYGGMLLGPLFQHRFKPLESDWLNIIAKK